MGNVLSSALFYSQIAVANVANNKCVRSERKAKCACRGDSELVVEKSEGDVSRLMGLPEKIYSK